MERLLAGGGIQAPSLPRPQDRDRPASMRSALIIDDPSQIRLQRIFEIPSKNLERADANSGKSSVYRESFSWPRSQLHLV